MSNDNNDNLWVPPSGRPPTTFTNISLSRPDPRPRIDDAINNTILRMLARSQGVGKTTSLARNIQQHHPDDGYLICLDSREAQRVYQEWGINTVSIEDYRSQCWYAGRIPFVDPDSLNTLISYNDRSLREQEDAYLRRLTRASNALQDAKAEARKNWRTVIETNALYRSGIAISFLIAAMTKLPSHKELAKDKPAV